MYRYRLIFLQLFLSMFFLLSQAQQLPPDSLEKQIANALTNKEKILPMANLCIFYYSYGDAKGLEYAKEAARLANQESDYKYGVYAYSSLAAIYADMDSIAQAYKTIDTCMWYIDNTTDVISKISGLNSMVIIKEIFNDKENIPDMLLEALNLVPLIPEDSASRRYEFEAKLYYSLYEYYIDIDPSLAKKYLDRSCHIAKKIDAPLILIRRFNGYWSCYKKMYEKSIPADKAFLDSALSMSNTAINYYAIEKRRIAGIDYAETLYNHADIHRLKANRDSALFYGYQLINLTTEISDIKTQAKAYDLLSKIEFEDNNLLMAEKLELQALSLINDETGNYDQLCGMYTYLADIYKGSENYVKATEAIEKASVFLGKKNNETYMREAQIAQAKLKVKQIHDELKESKRQNRIYIYYVVLSVLLLTVLVLGVIRYRARIKKGRKKELILIADKENARLQATQKQKEVLAIAKEKENVESLLEEEQNKSQLKSDEVVKLQKELLAGNIQLDYKNEVIDLIKTNLIDNKSEFDITYIRRLLREEKRNKNSFEEFASYVKKIHPQFYTRLQAKAQQRLTPLDLKYCTFIYMNLSSKEIASLLHIESKTVRMAKYRLKQKLKLAKEADLNEFIQKQIV